MIEKRDKQEEEKWGNGVQRIIERTERSLTSCEKGKTIYKMEEKGEKRDE
jgi:hypothetical protein